MNALVMADSLQQVASIRVQTAIAMQQVAEPYVRGRLATLKRVGLSLALIGSPLLQLQQQPFS